MASGSKRVEGTGCASLLFPFFLVAGLFFCALLLWKAVDGSQDYFWSRASCVIEHSGGQPVEGPAARGPYRYEVRYRYSFGGREYVSGSLGRAAAAPEAGAGALFTNDWEEVRSRLERYAPGTRVDCFVNPKDPSQAVLERSFPGMLALLPVPGSFVLVGIGGILFSRRLRSGKQASISGKGRVARADAPVMLRFSPSRWGRLLGWSAFGLVWNGIVGVFVIAVGSRWMSGEREMAEAYVLAPFVLVGFAVIGVAIYYALGLFAVKVRLTMSPGVLRVGGSAALEYRQSGSFGQLRTLRITLIGLEEARYSRGTDNVIEKSVFHDAVLAETGEGQPPDGACTISIPPRSMHSFKSPHNAVLWLLKVEGRVAGAPDICDEYPLDVLPAEARRRF
jgi:hypothetical protein